MKEMKETAEQVHKLFELYGGGHNEVHLEG